MRQPLDTIHITQKYGEDPDYYKKWGLAGHHGIDYRAWYVPAYAPEDGEIIVASNNGYTDPVSGNFVSGKVVVLRSANYDWWYLHLDQIDCHVGQKVKAGQKIAKTGNSGASTAAHLHLGCRPIKLGKDNGFRGFVDPEEILKKGASMEKPINDGDYDNVANDMGIRPAQTKKYKSWHDVWYGVVRPWAQKHRSEDPLNKGDIFNIAKTLGITQDKVKRKNWNEVYYKVIEPEIIKLKQSTISGTDATKWKKLKDLLGIK